MKIDNNIDINPVVEEEMTCSNGASIDRHSEDLGDGWFMIEGNNGKRIKVYVPSKDDDE